MNESVVYLQRSADGEIVEATLCDEITSEHLEECNKTWVPKMAAFCKNRPPTDKPDDSHWDWKGKAAAYSGLRPSHSRTRGQTLSITEGRFVIAPPHAPTAAQAFCPAPGDCKSPLQPRQGIGGENPAAQEAPS